MDKLDKSFFNKENLAKAMECKTPEELIELAKKYNIKITKEQAEAYLAELENVELDEKALDAVAGGICYDKTCPYQSSQHRARFF